VLPVDSRLSCRVLDNRLSSLQTVVFPFVNQAIADYTGVPASAVGYKAGVIESLFTFVQFCTILQWGRLSDRIGRKPVIVGSMPYQQVQTLLC
jgi:MFS family permease